MSELWKRTSISGRQALVVAVAAVLLIVLWSTSADATSWTNRSGSTVVMQVRGLFNTYTLSAGNHARIGLGGKFVTVLKFTASSPARSVDSNSCLGHYVGNDKIRIVLKNNVIHCERE